MKKFNKFGFTLAEVLITLGVIGVVASMTMPSIIKHHQQQATLSKVKKFYTTINQAIRQSEAENGSCSTWTRISNNTNSQKEFYDTYLSKYIKSINIKIETATTNKDGSIRYAHVIKLADGSAFWLENNLTTDTTRLFIIYFYPNINKLKSTNFTRDRFLFQLYNTNCTVEPYTLEWNGTENELKNKSIYGCNAYKSSVDAYCTKLIEYNGWQMPKDYPW